MTKKVLGKFATFAFVGALSLCMLAGCSSLQFGTQNSQQTQAQQESRAYMSKINQAMDDLNTRLESFTEAVSRGDVVSMRTQADNAYKALDTISTTDAPEALQSVKQGYVDGTNSLKSALDGYITLYTEIESATNSQAFDWSSYASKLAEIKSAYDAGISKLQEADKAASAM